jgi:hypothetical protein
LVALKTEKPAGKRLRRFLADEVLPKLRRVESIVPTETTPRESSVVPALLREQRLMAREKRLEARQRAQALRGWAKTVQVNGLAGNDVVLAYENEAASIEVGRPLLESRPTLESRLYNATELGETFGLSGKAIGIIAREIGIFDVKDFGQYKMSKAQSNDGVFSHWVYNERGKAAIEAEITARSGEAAG